jgi:hypothetical protein
MGDRIVWRGKQFRLVRGGKMVPLQKTAAEVMVG